MSVIQAVRFYQSLGWTVVPVHYRSKQAINGQWQDSPPPEQILKVYEVQESLNVGVHLGLPSGGLVDVDLDHPDAVSMASEFLPPTMTFGRSGNPRSHWLYRITGNLPTYKMFKGPEVGNIAELRTSIPGAKQTVLPPSIHETGQPIQWTEEFSLEKITEITAVHLRRQVGLMAACCILKRYWPEQGTQQRHNAYLALAGGLMNAGLEEHEIMHFVEVLCRATDESDPKDRVHTVRSTFRRKSKKKTGLSTLADFLSPNGEEAKDAVVDCLYDENDDRFFDDFNKEYAFIDNRGTVLIARRHEDLLTGRPVIDYYSVATFKDSLMGERVWVGAGDGRKSVDVAKHWLNTPGIKRKYHRMTCAPVGKTPDGIYNTWLGFSVDPRPGDWSLFRKHMLENIAAGNEDHFHWIMSFLAQAFQEPHNKPGVALVLQGTQGAGKTEFTKAILSLVLNHSVSIDNQTHLTGRFNAHMQDVLFLVANEAFFAGDHQAKSILKGLITDKTVMIERKGKDAIEMPSYLRLILTANDGWVAPKEKDDRRYAVFKVADDWVGRRDQFGAMIAQLDSGGREALLYELLNYKYDPEFITKIPTTQAGEDQRNLTRSPMEAWWETRLNEGNPCPSIGSWARRGMDGIDTWPQEVAKQALYDDFRATFGRNVRYERESAFWYEFYQMVPEAYRGRGALYTVRPFSLSEQQDKPVRMAYMKLPSWAEAKELYCRLRNRKVQWAVLGEDVVEEHHHEY